jgi:hypothetical protein
MNQPSTVVVRLLLLSKRRPHFKTHKKHIIDNRINITNITASFLLYAEEMYTL